MSSMAVLRQVLVLCIAVISLTGCIVHEKYPQGWAQKRETASDRCPDISGTYFDAAIGTKRWCQLKFIESHGYFVDEDCSLATILPPPHYNKRPYTETRGLAKACPTRKVEIHQPDQDTLVLHVLAGDEVVKTHTLSTNQGDFTCQEGTVERSDAEVSGGEFDIGIGNEIFTFFPAADGSLVMKHRSSGAGILLVVPLAFDLSSWYQWKRTKDTTEPVDQCTNSPRRQELLRGVAKDDLRAALSLVHEFDEMGHLLKLAENGNATAAYHLYVVLGSENLKEAWRWLCRAADSGNAAAQIEVGNWHRSSIWERSDNWVGSVKEQRLEIGTRPDDQVAYMWYSLAASKGHPFALEMREAVAKRLTVDQISVAQQMVRDWKPGHCPSKEQPLT